MLAYDKAVELATVRRRHWAKFFASSELEDSVRPEGVFEAAGEEWDNEEQAERGAFRYGSGGFNGFSIHEEPEAEDGVYGPEHEDHRFEQEGVGPGEDE